MILIRHNDQIEKRDYEKLFDVFSALEIQFDLKSFLNIIFLFVSINIQYYFDILAKHRLISFLELFCIFTRFNDKKRSNYVNLILYLFYGTYSSKTIKF